MVRFGPALEKRQAVLFRLVDIGAELFAMAATCARAQMLATAPRRPGGRPSREDQKGENPLELADLFCRQAKRRVKGKFASLFRNDDVITYKVAQQVLKGEHEWVEKGLVEV